MCPNLLHSIFSLSIYIHTVLGSPAIARIEALQQKQKEKAKNAAYLVMQVEVWQ